MTRPHRPRGDRHGAIPPAAGSGGADVASPDAPVGAVPTRTAAIAAVSAQARRGRDGTLHVPAASEGAGPVISGTAVDGQAAASAIAGDRLSPRDGGPAQGDAASAQRVRVAHGTVRGGVALPRYTAPRLAVGAP